MGIVKMSRFTLMTFNNHKAELLKALQQFQQVHFKPLRLEEYDENLVRNTESAIEFESALSKLNFTVGILKPFTKLRKGLAALRENPQQMTFKELDSYVTKFDYESVCASVIDCDDRLKKLQSELIKLNTENDNLQSWLSIDAAPSKLNELQSIRSIIGAIKTDRAEDFLFELKRYFPDVYAEQMIKEKQDAVYLLLVHESEWEELSDLLKRLNFTKTQLPAQELPSHKVKINQERVIELENSINEVNKELEVNSKHYQNLLIVTDYFKTALARVKVCENFMNLGQALIIEGWVPTCKMDKLRDLAKSVCDDEYYIEDYPEELDSTNVPIKLKNNSVIGAFESITSMYSLPRYNELDPTPLLTPFYLLFFGLMVGDAGYGLIILAATFLAMKFLHFKPKMLNFIKFFHYISYAIILAGFLYGSVFGFTPSFLNLAMAADGTPKPLICTELDIVTMMIVSISVGVVHVLFGVALKAYLLMRNGKYLDAILDPLLWMIAVIGGIGWIIGGMTGIFPEWAVESFRWGFIISMVVLVFSQGRESKSLGGKIGAGLFGAYGITGYLGDLVSYTRIVALALSSAYIAMSFNLMAGLMPNLPLQIIAGSLIFLVGQTLNLGLGLLGAYVHSCRLQYVEYFGKFYNGGGVAFKPLEPQNTTVRLTDLNT